MANNETPNPADNADGAKPADVAANPADAGKPDDSRRGDNRGGGRGGSRGPRKDFSPPKYQDKDGNELTEKVVFINRCSKVVKGGRRFSFSALVVSGNQKGSVGVGFGSTRMVSVVKSTQPVSVSVTTTNSVCGLAGAPPTEVFVYASASTGLVCDCASASVS